VLVVESETPSEGVRPPRHHPQQGSARDALSLSSFRRRSGDVFEVNVGEDLQVSSLMLRLDAVIRAHEGYIADQLRRTTSKFGVVKARLSRLRRSRFASSTEAVAAHRRATTSLRWLGAQGVPGIPSDHEHVLDSDSILSMRYLPASLRFSAQVSSPANMRRSSPHSA